MSNTSIILLKDFVKFDFLLSSSTKNAFYYFSDLAEDANGESKEGDEIISKKDTLLESTAVSQVTPAVAEAK